MKDMKNKPRISKWIGGGYILLTALVVVIYAAIVLSTNVLSYLVAGAVVVIVMTFALFLVGATAFCLYETVYEVKDGSIHACSPFAIVNLKVKEIAKIERTLIPFYFKGFGASLYSGWFYIPTVGWTKVIITNLTDGVLITDKKGKHYLITPSNPDRFIKSVS